MSISVRLGVVAVLLAGALDFLANFLAAHYLVPFATFLIPGGTFVFAFTFVLYDYIRRVYGLIFTVAAIGLGFVASVVYSAAFGGGVGQIALAGLIALACSGSSDLAMQTFTLRWPIWSYVAASNAVSLLIDSIVFALIAFSMLPWAVRLQIIEGQYLAKGLVTILAIPLVYQARAWTARVSA